jgi:hypothetical protein
LENVFFVIDQDAAEFDAPCPGEELANKNRLRVQKGVYEVGVGGESGLVSHAGYHTPKFLRTLMNAENANS